MKHMAAHFEEGSFLNLFFAEKDIEEKVFIKEDSEGMTHIIPNECVIEALAQTEGSEREGIEDILRRIDFGNGDVNHFLEHLAGALAEKMRMA